MVEAQFFFEFCTTCRLRNYNIVEGLTEDAVFSANKFNKHNTQDKTNTI